MCNNMAETYNLNSEWKRASYRKYMQHNCIYVVFQTGKTQVFFLGMHTQELKLKKKQGIAHNQCQGNDYRKGKGMVGGATCGSSGILLLFFHLTYIIFS